MALVVEFLSNIRVFLKTRDGDKLREWLLVEPPVPDQYHKLSGELRRSAGDGDAVLKLVEEHLPEEDEVAEDQGTSWPGFASFMKDYFEYWRDVNFDDLLSAHQLLYALTNSCYTALNHPTYGSVMLMTSISLCSSLSKLSMTLNKRPDLTRKLRTFATGDEDQKSVVETTAEIIQKIFTSCLTDRASQRYAKPEGKKIGVYIFANITLKLLFTGGKTYLAKQLFTNITAKSPPLSYYPAAQRVTYLYYLGRFHFINNHFSRAAACLQEAYLETPTQFQKHRQLILTHLIPTNIILGRLPSQALLRRPEAKPLAPVFSQISQSIRTGNYFAFQETLKNHDEWLFDKGLLLTLRYRLRPLLWRSFSRRTFLLTYVVPDAAEAADSRKAATLELSHLHTTALYIQKRLEGYLPAKPKRPAHINSMFLKAVSNSADAGADQTASTLAPPPGGPRKLHSDEGLIWGNMAPTEEHVEDMAAALVSRGLLHGYLSHSQGRFAIMGTKQKGSAVVAGWPAVAEVLRGDPNDEVPGWVRG